MKGTLEIIFIFDVCSNTTNPKIFKKKCKIKGENIMTKNELLLGLKEDFRQWCGLLSIDEIVSNSKLIRVIERLERMLVAVSA